MYFLIRLIDLIAEIAFLQVSLTCCLWILKNEQLHVQPGGGTPAKIPYLRTQNLKNHTLFRGTYLYSPYMGVPSPPPPGTCSSLFQITLQKRDNNDERKARTKARSILIITQINNRHLSLHFRATVEIALNLGLTFTATQDDAHQQHVA